MRRAGALAALAVVLALGFGPSPSVLGAERAQAAAHIFGGTPAAPGTLPFLAHLIMRVPGAAYACTGSVIAPNAILTAAHCTHDPNTGAPFPVSAFSVATKTVNLTPLDAGAEVLTVSAVHAYQPAASDLLGDVAVLTLATPTTATPVRLATPADSALYAPSTPVDIAGWGQTAVDGAPSPILERGTQSLEPNYACAGNSRFVAAVQVCTTAPGFRPAVCHGDSGGPLLATDAQGPVEIGVASYSSGTSCGTDPDYFARVSTMQSWIESQVSGGPAPPAYSPPLVSPQTVALRLVKDGALVRFPAVVPDPATELDGYKITLKTAAGREVASESVDTNAFSWSFTDLAPGSYEATVAADYSTGLSPAAVSTQVTLALPVSVKAPAVLGRPVAGSRLSCGRGVWRWPGAPTFTVRWLRNGASAGARSPLTTGYVATAADTGKRIACRVTLMTATGATVTAASKPVTIQPA